MSVTVRKLAPVHADERGAIVDLFNGDESVAHVGLITFAPGAIRANHYHEHSAQIDYILSGKLELRTRPANDADAAVESHLLEPGDVVSIPAGTVHAYRAIDTAAMVDITTLSREGTGYEDDTIRVASLFD